MYLKFLKICFLFHFENGVKFGETQIYLFLKSLAGTSNLHSFREINVTVVSKKKRFTVKNLIGKYLKYLK